MRLRSLWRSHRPANGASMSEWNIHVTNHGDNHEEKGVPRFVVRAKLIKTGDPVVIYGVGDTELQARQDAKQKMPIAEKKVKA